MSARKAQHLVLGTAGHIDHGKSTLVQALTGTDPDRLAEEKKRGITIELGFAQLTLPNGTSLGVVDVPGHERFVRQMIAGATGIDLALLCIAADDGVMPQTREHVAVLELLGIASCVIALTKADLVDQEWLEFMEDDVRGKLAGTPFADAPLVAVSARTGQGIPQLLSCLQEAAASASHGKPQGPLRLPVDRSFSIKGAGTVVTGTLWSGTVSPGDEVEILPTKQVARVRSVQEHGAAVEVATSGNRVALNLNGVEVAQVQPGMFLAQPGLLEPTDRFDARLTYLGFGLLDQPLKAGARVRIAHGTTEVAGRILPLDGSQAIKSGTSLMVQVRLDEPLPMSPQDRFIMRLLSPVRVIGGGVVLNAHPRRRSNLVPAEQDLLAALYDHDAEGAIDNAIALQKNPFTCATIQQASCQDAACVLQRLDALTATGKLARIGQDASPVFLPKPQLQKLESQLENALVKFHAQEPQALGLPKAALRERYAPQLDEAAFDAVLSVLVDKNVLASANGLISHPRAGSGAKLLDQQTAQKLLAALKDAGTTPPPLSQALAAAAADSQVAYRALNALEKEGAIRKVNADLAFEETAFQSLADRALKLLEGGTGATAAQLKDAMGTSRKYAIPLLEYLDAQGLTQREGDVRVMGPKASAR